MICAKNALKHGRAIRYYCGFDSMHGCDISMIDSFAQCMAQDVPLLQNRLRRLSQRQAQAKPADRLAHALEQAVAESMAKVAQRVAGAPVPRFAQDLPVNQHRAEILALLQQHQVLVVCGETGSGKTTQLPQLCLAAGRGVRGLIGHTQPRRIAARTVAMRIAEELGSPLGQAVGFKVRFADQTRPQSYIKLMTDGILLAELRHDPLLRQYDTLIIDEAHERSLNIDFLLGYLRHILPQRPDLKLIITSATLDPERIAAHFGKAPMYTVPGRTYPVEVRYRPVAGEDEDERERDLYTAITDAVDELAREGPGDILIFLPGEREIREANEALRQHHPKHTEILPLYARLSAAEQQRAFQPHRGRRIILATNVAETALTVPGIRYVIDTGLARIARYSPRSRLQRLSLEAISQASAQQRSGRCGRLGPGICIRLYSEEDFATRPAFTDPEILRTHLAAVILQMASLGLGDPADFPFIDPPDTRQIKDGYQLLTELKAVDAQSQITALGAQLARLPLDPQLGAMLLAAEREGALPEVLIVASFLALQDPRERPAQARQAADQAHAIFRDTRSDFLGILNLWDQYHEQARHLSRNQLRTWCKTHFLSYLRMREWHELHGQLRAALSELPRTGAQSATPAPTPAKHRPPSVSPAPPPAEINTVGLHRALLAGLPSSIGQRTEKGDYLGTRQRRFLLHPASALARKPPRWVLAAEITETTRVFARECAAIAPEWVEEVAAHLLKEHLYEPHFQERSGRVGAYAQVSLHGLIINPKKRVNYAQSHPQAARELFIREGLVNARLRTRAPFLAHNQALIAEIEALEAKGRRRDWLADEQVIYDFYAQQLPPQVCDGPSLEHWYRQASRKQPQCLRLTREQVLQQSPALLGPEQFPDWLEHHGLRLPLTYRFEPGQPEDGVTLTLPAAALNTVEDWLGEWLVPGLLEEKLTALIKSLPKTLRRHFVPAPDFARAALERLESREGPLLAPFASALQQITGVVIPPDAWRVELLEAHLRMRYRILDADGNTVAAERDLATLRQNLQAVAQQAHAAARPQGFERTRLTQWDFGPLPESVDFVQHGMSLRGYPALQDQGDCVDLVLCDTPLGARILHQHGLGRLFMLQCGDTLKYLRRQLPGIEDLCLKYTAIDSCEALKDDLLKASIQRCFLVHPWPTDAAQFAHRLETGRAQLVATATELTLLVGEILDQYRARLKQTRGNLPLSWIEACADIEDQLQYLLYPGFIWQTPAPWLSQLPRYLRAIERRLARVDQAPDKDRRIRVELLPLWEQCKARLAQRRPYDPALPAEVLAHDPRWLFEELRVSLFAQELGTTAKVSVKRLAQQLHETPS